MISSPEFDYFCSCCSFTWNTFPILSINRDQPFLTPRLKHHPHQDASVNLHWSNTICSKLWLGPCLGTTALPHLTGDETEAQRTESLSGSGQELTWTT